MAKFRRISITKKKVQTFEFSTLIVYNNPRRHSRKAAQEVIEMDYEKTV